MSRTILLGFAAGELSEADLAQIRSLTPGYRLLVTTDRQEIEANLGEIEIAVRRFPNEWIERAPNLRWLQQWGAGADWLLRYPAVAASDLIVTSGSGVHAIPISEHILALMLALGRNLHRAIRHQIEHRWQSVGDWHQLFELANKTMLLVGVGAIGERTAEVATALGMRVIGVRRDPAQTVPGVAAMYAPAQLPELLPEADFVVLTIPLTAETKHLIGEREFQLMKPSAYLINIGRGGTVDEAALIEALRSGRLAGAGLDVTEQEPLPADSPLWDLENVIITAHYAGATPHYDERALPIFLENLRRYVADEPLINVVDKTLGY